jgi:signal transduction histidine kinase
LIAVMLPLVGLAVFFVVTSVQDSRDRAREDALAVARAGALATDSFFDGHQRTLRAIALGVRNASSLSASELRDQLLVAGDASPEWDGLSVVAADGIAIAGTRETTAGVDLSDRPYLQRMFATGETVVSEGIITAVEGIPSVLIATPVDFEDGTRGALIGSVTLRTLTAALTETLTPAAGVGLIDDLGQTLVHPDPTRVAALVNVSDRPEVIAAWSGESGTIDIERDGASILAAYAPVTSLGWAVTAVADADAEAAYADADAIARRGAIFIVLAVLVVLVGGWSLGGRMNRSREATLLAQRAEAEARERAEAALRSRDEFISIASHELRNPVAAISGFGQLMKRRLERDALTEADVRDYADSVASSGAYLSRLVDDLLSVSRLEGRRLDLRLDEVDVVSLLHRAIAEAPLADHVIITRVPDEPLMAAIDADRVHQILSNLLENAAKYAPDGSEVLVEAWGAEGSLKIRVTDSGIGVPEAETARLFQPFGRASNAREANIPGLGLGLYVSHRLAEAHGGTLDAQSRGSGRGSTFTLTLPLMHMDDTPASARGASATL